MHEALTADFGVGVCWVESQSRDTAENAAYLTPMLARDGHRPRRAGDARFHMSRTLSCPNRPACRSPAPARFFSAPPDSGLLSVSPATGLPGIQARRAELLRHPRMAPDAQV